MSAVQPLGYKPQVVCGVLGISDQTLRYWRAKLIPNGNKAFFSGRDILALKILCALVYECRFEVRELENFPIMDLFNLCRTMPLTALKGSILCFNQSDYTILMESDEACINHRNRAIVALYLDDLVDELATRMFDFGV